MDRRKEQKFYICDDEGWTCSDASAGTPLTYTEHAAAPPWDERVPRRATFAARASSPAARAAAFARAFCVSCGDLFAEMFAEMFAEIFAEVRERRCCCCC